MKNLFFSFLMLILSAGIAFGQMSNTEILEMIQKSKEFNKKNAGVLNPSEIWPGQTLTYFFEDGKSVTILVEDGDNQWTIVRDKLTKLREVHGEVVNPIQDTQLQPTTNEVVVPEPLSWWAFFPWGWLLVTVCLLTIAIKLLTMFDWKKLREKRKGKFSSTPTTEGKPFVEGGVSVENAQNHFVNLAQRSNPGADIQITNRRQGYLSTIGGVPAIVEFADKTKQNLSFRNEPAFAGLVSVNGKPANEEYCFQGCGNPVYSRRSMRAGKNLIFTTEPINFGDEVIKEKVNHEVVKVETELEKVEEQQKPVVVVDSEAFRIQNHQLSVIEELAGNQKIHKAVQKIIYNKDGSWSSEVSIDTKNDPATPKEN